MRKIRLLAIVLFSLLVMAGATYAAPTNRNFNAHLIGDEEVPPVVNQTQGEAVYHVSKDGMSVDYKLVVANIENVVAGHIHLAPFGVSGPVVVPLVSTSACETFENGIRCEGTFTAADLRGPLAGHPLSDLIAAMEAGNTYTNVHTTVHPGGEARGQIR